MLQFPDIALPKTPEDQPEDIGIATQMESGQVVSRARFTRSRLTFILPWGPDKNLLPTEDKEILKDFYMDQTKGSSEKFEWTCNNKFSPYYGQTFTVRFIGNPPKFKLVVPGFWSTSLTIQEE